MATDQSLITLISPHVVPVPPLEVDVSEGAASSRIAVSFLWTVAVVASLPVLLPVLFIVLGTALVGALVWLPATAFGPAVTGEHRRPIAHTR